MSVLVFRQIPLGIFYKQPMGCEARQDADWKGQILQCGKLLFWEMSRSHAGLQVYVLWLWFGPPW